MSAPKALSILYIGCKKYIYSLLQSFKVSNMFTRVLYFNNVRYLYYNWICSLYVQLYCSHNTFWRQILYSLMCVWLHPFAFLLCVRRLAKLQRKQWQFKCKCSGALVKKGYSCTIVVSALTGLSISYRLLFTIHCMVEINKVRPLKLFT